MPNVRKPWRLKYVRGILATHMEIMVDLGAGSFLDFRKHLPGSNDFKKGQIIEGQYDEGIMILQEVVEDPFLRRFQDIPQEVLDEWACVTYPNGIYRKQVFDIMHSYYCGFEEDTLVSVIRLRFLSFDDGPKVWTSTPQ